MAIINTKSFPSELATMFGFPTSPWCHLTTSSSAYINTELFTYWVDHVFIPGIENQRRALGLDDTTQALLVMDGCLSHSTEKLDMLKEKNIDYHIFVPHSSHLCQPLDRGIFSYLKAYLKSERCKIMDHKIGKRLIQLVRP